MVKHARGEGKLIALLICACTIIRAPVCMAQESKGEQLIWGIAEYRARIASEAFQRANRVMHAWWKLRDRQTQFFPRRVNQPIWAPQDNAADMYPFLVLTAYFTEPAMIDDLLIVMRNEIALTNRIDRLPDWYSLKTHAFAHPKPDMRRLIFGASEYAKDGLIPMTEVMGRGVWTNRMLELVNDIFKHAPIKTPYGNIPANDTEVNGEMLQVLSRLAFMTNDPRYLRWAERIGDAYCFEVLPRCNYLPAHRWDFNKHQPITDVLSLSDHGNEIIGGLAELFVATRYLDPVKAQAYEEPLQRMFDRLLKVARNEDGLWFARLKASTGEVISKSTPDTWGYALSGVYTFGLLTGARKYMDAARRALEHINKERYYEWGGADAYADSIEGALLLLNRRGIVQGFRWLEEVVPRFFAKQRKDGIVEGWYGDGNYARTALMIALYYTQGTYVRDWREDIKLGAVRSGRMLYIHLRAKRNWMGRLHFDYPRHREHLNLPVNYPRLNEFPEWFVVEPTSLYEVRINGGEPQLRLGAELMRGLIVKVAKGRTLHITIKPHVD